MELSNFITYKLQDVISLLAEMDGLDWSEYHLKNCINCNKEFITKQNRKKYCSEDCRLGKVVARVPDRVPVPPEPVLDDIDLEIKNEPNPIHVNWLRKYRRKIVNWDAIKHNKKYILRLGVVDGDGKWYKPYSTDVGDYERANPEDDE